MESKKINQLATEMAPASTDLTIIGDPITGVSKKVTLEQISSLFASSISFYTNYASFPATGNIDTLYCAKDTNKLYLWSGSAYVETFPSQALLDTYQLRSEKGNANGYASLDGSGKVPSTQLPSYVDDIIEVANYASLPVTGETGKIYITLDNNKIYRWSGSVYVEIAANNAIWGSITGTLSNQTDLQNALNAKVPYTGATANVNLGEYELKTGQLTLDTTPTGTATVGTTRWNDTIGSSETTLKGGNVILKNGVDLVARVVNKVSPNTTLTKAAYPAVRVSGAQGQRLAIAYAQANNDNNSADTIGLVTETIATNQEGFIMTVGQLEGIDTTGSLQGETWADGDVLYLSPTTAGALTNIKPTGATGHIVVMGYVEYAHANNGKIYVKIMNGWELDELHNVYISSVANNEGLFYESSTSLWKNKSIATVLGYTPADDSAVVKLTGTQTVGGTKTFSSQPKFDLGIAIKEGTSGGLTGYTCIGANVNQLLIGIVGATHTLTFPTSSSYTYTFPSGTGTLALSSDLSSYVPTSRTVSTTSPLSGGGALSSDLTLSISQASGSANGYLSSTDWTTFNNKQNALTNPVTGTGTTNYVPKFTGTSTIGNSLIYDNGTNVGIGTASPAAKLDINGGDLYVRTGGTIYGNTFSSYSGNMTIALGGSGNNLIVSGGNVGIGTTSPTTYSLSGTHTEIYGGSSYSFLHVNTATVKSFLATNESALLTALFTFSAHPLTFGTNNTERMRISSAGNVGIGTTSPTSPLHVGTSTSGNQKIQHWGEPGFVDNYGLILRGSSLDGVFKFYGLNNGTETTNPILSMNRSSGNVGIGTTAPASLLEIAATSPTLRINSTTGGNDGILAWYVNTNYIGDIRTNSSSGAMTFNQGPSAGWGGYMVFKTDTSERMRITSAGNIAIGGTSGTGRVQIWGVDQSSSNYTQINYDSQGNVILFLRNDGLISTGTRAVSPYNLTTGTAANMVVDSSGYLYRSTSSLKYKTDVRNYDKGLAEVLQMRPVYYKGKNDGEKQFAGLIAEEVQDLGLTEFVQYAPDGTPDALAYSNMVTLLVKAIQEQQQQIEELKAKIK